MWYKTVGAFLASGGLGRGGGWRGPFCLYRELPCRRRGGPGRRVNRQEEGE